MHKFNEYESLTLDYAKAIGIFFVVIGHYDASVLNLFKPYMFHMPLFFFIGGLTLNHNKPVMSFLKTITKSLVLYAIFTYILIGVVSEIISKIYSIQAFGNAFVSDPITTIKTAFKYNFANHRMFVVAWFLVAYFWASLLCVIFCKAIKAISLDYFNLILLLSGLLIGVFAMDFYNTSEVTQSRNLLIQIMVAIMFFMAGCASRQFMNFFSSPVLAIVCCLTVYLLRNYGFTKDFIMSISFYPYGAIITIVQAACGIAVVLFMSRLLAAFKFEWILAIGRRTKTIMSYHILSFVMLDIFFYMTDIFDIHTTDAFVHFKSWYSMPLYVSTGIALPTLFSYATQLIKKHSMPHSLW
ncbi:acyltransferase family protein [Cronobacter malonaticus]